MLPVATITRSCKTQTSYIEASVTFDNMHLLNSFALLLLALNSCVLACSCPPNSRIEDCLKISAFGDCCRRVKLDTTSQHLSLKAFCPAIGLQPNSYVFTRLYLDECLTFDNKNNTLRFIDQIGGAESGGM